MAGFHRDGHMFMHALFSCLFVSFIFIVHFFVDLWELA